MTKEQEKKLIDLKVRQQLKQDELERAENDEQLATITAEIEKIKNEIQAVEDEVAEINGENQQLLDEERKKMENGEVRKVTIVDEKREAEVKAIEERAKALKEGRAVVISSEQILVPTHQAKEIKDTPYKQFSDIVDMVETINLDGGESHEFAFVKSYGTAGLTAEGGEYHETEPQTDYDTISKAKITVYTEVSEETLKLPAINYEAIVKKNIDVAIKKKFAQQITAGSGDTNTFKGILSGKAKALEATDTVEVTAIDRLTLKNIMYALGGDEEIFGGGVLQLNKLTLQEFDELYNADRGDFEYKIDYNKQTINGIPYIINNNLPSFKAATEGQTFIIYGMPKAYGVRIFSPVEIQRSTDYKFRTGMVAYKASVFAGGNVVGYRGFVLAKKKANA